MRPRVFPAEDSGHVEETESEVGASMRPRVFPAEDLRAAIDSVFGSGRLQ